MSALRYPPGERPRAIKKVKAIAKQARLVIISPESLTPTAEFVNDFSNWNASPREKHWPVNCGGETPDHAS